MASKEEPQCPIASNLVNSLHRPILFGIEKRGQNPLRSKAKKLIGEKSKGALKRHEYKIG
jgi:hypothetical protein